MSEYIITKSHLDLQRKDDSQFRRVLTLSRAERAINSRGTGVSVFLSHKHNEVTIMENVIALLKNCGVCVYVDWMDEEMPKTTSGLTAMKLKEKINSCKKFIFLATEGAISSKWCNWELGFGDAKKYPENIALMPIADSDGSYSGSEYLQNSGQSQTITLSNGMGIRCRL